MLTFWTPLLKYISLAVSDISTRYINVFGCFFPFKGKKISNIVLVPHKKIKNKKKRFIGSERKTINVPF